MTTNHEPIEFAHGRASVSNQDEARDLIEGARDGGRDAILYGACSLTEWLVWDWTRQVDERLDITTNDLFDLADRVHVLNVTVIVSFLVLVLALSIVLAVVIL